MVLSSGLGGYAPPIRESGLRPMGRVGSGPSAVIEYPNDRYPVSAPQFAGLGLLTYFDPRVGTFQDAAMTIPAMSGDPLGGWQDQINPAVTATQSTAGKRLNLVTSSGGQTVARADGVDDDLLTGSLAGMGQPYTIATIVILRNNPGTATARVLRQATNWQITITQTTRVVGMTSGANLVQPAVVDGTPVVLIGVFNGTSSVGRVGATETTGNMSNGGASGIFAIASLESGASGFVPCDYGPILRYTGFANATQRAAIAAWLQTATGW